jgi:hypothetical protein
MLRKFTMKMGKGVSIALLGIVVLTYLFLGGATRQPDLVEAATSDGGAIVDAEANWAASPFNAPASTWTICNPTRVGVFPERIHVRCAEPVSGGIDFFALSTADASHTARVLSILSTALAAGRTLEILYDPTDTSGTAINCAEANCRLIIAVQFWQ